VKKIKSLRTAEDILSEPASASFVSANGLVIFTGTIRKDKEDLRANFRTEDFGIMLVLSGHARIRINLREYRAQKSDTLMVSPNCLKQFVSFSDDFSFTLITFSPRTLTWLGIDGKGLSLLLQIFSHKYEPRWRLKRNDVVTIKNRAGELRKLVLNLSATPFGKELLMHSFCSLLYECASLTSKYSEPIVSKLPRKESLVVKFVDQVARHFRAERNVIEYGRKLNITPKYLTETVKQITGKTAGELIDEFVIMEAKALLLDQGLSISQIADELNFSDQSFFGKYFKRLVGVSPSNYRRSKP